MAQSYDKSIRGVSIDHVRLRSADSILLDAFSRIRVSEPVTLFDSQQQYDKGRLFWQELIAGSASTAHNADESAVDLTVTANASDSVIRQSREYIRYQPGKSQLILMTAAFGAATSGVTKCFGYYDAENGFYLEQTATGGYNIVRRSSVTGSVVNTSIAQADWNLDTLDGTGKQANSSSITLDATKAQIFIIDLQWLSVGRVRIGFDINGSIIYVHEFLHANVAAGPYMTTANLPCRYEITTDGTNGDSFKTICSTVIVEGGFETDRGSTFHVGNGTTAVSVGVTFIPILSIRSKATFNSIVNRGLIVLDDAEIYTASSPIHFEIIYGGTLTAPSFSSVNDDSIVEFDVAASAISGGIALHGDYTDKRGQVSVSPESRYPLALDIAGAHPTSPYSDIITIAAVKLSGSDTDCYGSLSWKEYR